MAGNNSDLAINAATLPETLAALRAWYAAYQQHAAVALPAGLGPVYAACQRLFAPPEPAPALPDDLVAALRDWVTYVSRSGYPLHRGPSELERLTAAAERLVFLPAPSRCAVPDCNAVAGPAWGYAMNGRNVLEEEVTCDRHRAWLIAQLEAGAP